MKIYKAIWDGDKIEIGEAEATITAKQIMLDDYHRAWGSRRFNKKLPLHKSPRAALKALIEEKAREARQLQAEIRRNQGAIEAARNMMEEL